MMDQKTEQLLQNYRKGVEKAARNIYLKAIALKKEIDDDPTINPEDRLAILVYTINILTGEKK